MYVQLDAVRKGRYATVLIIYLSFFLDNMLLTVVVPIIPDFLHTTSLKLIPKSAFHDNLENLVWPNMNMEENKSTTRYQPNYISTNKMYQANDISTNKYQPNDISTPNVKTKLYNIPLIKINQLSLKGSNNKSKDFEEVGSIKVRGDAKGINFNNTDLQKGKSSKGNGEDFVRAKAINANNADSGKGKSGKVESKGDFVKAKELVVLQEDEEIESENAPVGILLSSKAVVQLFLNPVVGVWASKVGYRVPIFFGSVNLLLASLLFAYGESYLSMLVARAVQGVCSACIGVAGMCLAAETFKTEVDQGEMEGSMILGGDRARSRAMGILLGGGALGVLTGYPMGSLLYDFVGKQAPFLVIAAMVCVTLVLQVAFFDFSPPIKMAEKRSATVWWPLLTDSVIVVSTGAIFISTSAMAILEPCLPIWLMTHLKPEKWQVGTVFIPDSLGYLLGTNMFGEVACRVGQWRVSVVALITVGVAAFIIPSAVSLSELLLPHFVLGLGIGALDAALVPLLASLVDSRHTACYEAAFALQQTAVSLAYSVAPLAGGALARGVGFAWTMRGVGLLNAIYSPMLAAIAWKFTSAVQSTRLTDSQSSDCEGLNQAINMATYGTTFD